MGGKEPPGWLLIAIGGPGWGGMLVMFGRSPFIGIWPGGPKRESLNVAGRDWGIACCGGIAGGCGVTCANVGRICNEAGTAGRCWDDGVLRD